MPLIEKLAIKSVSVLVTGVGKNKFNNIVSMMCALPFSVDMLICGMSSYYNSIYIKILFLTLLSQYSIYSLWHSVHNFWVDSDWAHYIKDALFTRSKVNVFIIWYAKGQTVQKCLQISEVTYISEIKLPFYNR